MNEKLTVSIKILSQGAVHIPENFWKYPEVLKMVENMTDLEIKP